MRLKTIQNNRIFFFILLIYWLFMGIMLVLFGYNGSFLLINGLHQPLLDMPMFLMTHLGDALILTSILALILSGKNPALVFYIIVMVIITGLFGQLLKNTVFDSFDRPLKVFEGMDLVHTVAGYKMYHNSFPSGHSIVAAAAITSMVAVLNPNKYIEIVAALSIVIISYTRIYVGVHFPGDVLLGSLIGTIGAIGFIRPIYLPLARWANAFSAQKRTRTTYLLWIIASISILTGIYLIYIYIG
ncbi:MAG: phosphatase PAP2 family protein [Lentimicrobium sp.]|jgi:undecaprenyl-diphosphatase|nr:phosphatase PAP2 family protein [Lentimicrobium sp.]